MVTERVVTLRSLRRRLALVPCTGAGRPLSSEHGAGDLASRVSANRAGYSARHGSRLLRRNYFPPTASATYLNGASLFPYGGPPAAVFDGDDNHFIWQTTTAGDPNAGTVLTVDLGGYFSLGAVRPLYFPLGGPEQYPVSQQVRLATNPSEWTTVVPMTTVSAADSTLSFNATPARYIELTELGAHAGSYGGRLIELFAYPSAQTSPPLTSAGYDLAYLGATSTVNSNFSPMGTVWPQSWPAGAFFMSTPPNGATGDAVGTVDLGAQYDVSRLSLCFFWSGPGWANGGRLEVAPASGSFSTIYDSGLGNAFTKGVSPCEEYTFPTQRVRTKLRVRERLRREQCDQHLRCR
jgi:hypothetical protein